MSVPTTNATIPAVPTPVKYPTIVNGALVNNTCLNIPRDVNVIYLSYDYIRQCIAAIKWFDERHCLTFAIQTVYSLNYLPVPIYDKLAKVAECSELTCSLRCNFIGRCAIVLNLPQSYYLSFKKILTSWLSNEEATMQINRKYMLNHPAGIRYQFSPSNNNNYKVTVPDAAKDSYSVMNPLLNAPKKRKLEDDDDSIAPVTKLMKLENDLSTLDAVVARLELQLAAVHSAYKSCHFANKEMAKKLIEAQNLRLPLKPVAVNTAVKRKTPLKRKGKSFRTSTVYLPEYKQEVIVGNNNNNDNDNSIDIDVSASAPLPRKSVFQDDHADMDFKDFTLEDEEEDPTECDSGASTESVEWD